MFEQLVSFAALVAEFPSKGPLAECTFDSHPCSKRGFIISRRESSSQVHDLYRFWGDEFMYSGGMFMSQPLPVSGESLSLFPTCIHIPLCLANNNTLCVLQCALHSSALLAWRRAGPRFSFPPFFPALSLQMEKKKPECVCCSGTQLVISRISGQATSLLYTLEGNATDPDTISFSDGGTIPDFVSAHYGMDFRPSEEDCGYFQCPGTLFLAGKNPSVCNDIPLCSLLPLVDCARGCDSSCPVSFELTATECRRDPGPFSRWTAAWTDGFDLLHPRHWSGPT